MIFEELAKTTKDMQVLQKKMSIQRNKDAQEATDAKFLVLLSQADQFVAAIDYLYSNTSSETNSDIINSITDVFNTLESAIDSGLADADTVVKAENAYKNTQNEMKKDWTKKYSELTGATVSTLEAIRGIATDKVDECIVKIKTASAWESNSQQLESMKKGLDEAEDLILSLGLDEEIKTFLQNTTDGKATLKDLNDKVLKWIRDEGLENKIRISFAKVITRL